MSCIKYQKRYYHLKESSFSILIAQICLKEAILHTCISRNQLSTMKAILLVAAVSFVLAVGFAVPFGDEDLGAQDNELRGIADELGDDFEREDLERYDA